jgi:hypothetical protein
MQPPAVLDLHSDIARSKEIIDTADGAAGSVVTRVRERVAHHFSPRFLLGVHGVYTGFGHRLWTAPMVRTAAAQDLLNDKLKGNFTEVSA